MNYWLMKTEPSTFSWNQLVKDKKTMWDGVRNHLAAKNMRSMKQGDLVMIYHSMTDKSIQGIARVTKEAYPDPTATEGNWVVVDVAPVEAFTHPVTLQEVKADPRLQSMMLVTHSRLSVQPVEGGAWKYLCKKGNQKHVA